MIDIDMRLGNDSIILELAKMVIDVIVIDVEI